LKGFFRMNRILLITIALFAASPALAHPGHGGGFASGLGHPFAGLDHVLAMLAVGLWAALRGRGAMLAWPAAFVAAMAAGFAMTQGGLVVPAVETMILASVVLLGSAIALRLEAPVWLGAVAIALFGIAHGAAHGMELHGQPLPFAGGFILASVLLHAAGLGLAALAAAAGRHWPVRLAGAGVAAAGLALAASAI
jgi:urease accessory protein